MQQRKRASVEGMTPAQWKVIRHAIAAALDGKPPPKPKKTYTKRALTLEYWRGQRDRAGDVKAQVLATLERRVPFLAHTVAERCAADGRAIEVDDIQEAFDRFVRELAEELNPTFLRGGA